MGPEKPYRDPAFLRVAYWQRGQTTTAIAEVCGVSDVTIGRWMETHDIPRRESGLSRIPDDELLADLRRVAGVVDDIPSTVDYNRFGEYSTVVFWHRFGGWTDALRAADLFGGER
mgnify:CR=1 FL=1